MVVRHCFSFQLQLFENSHAKEKYTFTQEDREVSE